MKKIIFIFIILFVLIKANAQINTDTTAKFRNELFNKGRVSFGIKAGFTSSTLYGSEISYIFADSKTEYLPGFHVGIMVNSMAGKYFWMKHELLLVKKGAGVTLTDSINGNYSSKLQMLSLNLFPISPTFHYKGFQVYAGPYLGALINAQIKRKDANGNDYNDRSIFGSGLQFEDKYPRSKYLQKIDFGINAGIEYQFPFGLFIGAKYMQGFVEVFQYANALTFQDNKDKIKIYNRSLMLSVGYSFRAKR
jgi:hypothetical protein